MTDDEPEHLCDACGDPIIGEHDTDGQACGTGDGPGFLLCRDDECVTMRPTSLRARRQLYARQRKANEERHIYTAETTVAFHIEMHTITEDESFDLGGLLGLKTDALTALPKSVLCRAAGGSIGHLIRRDDLTLLGQRAKAACGRRLKRTASGRSRSGWHVVSTTGSPCGGCIVATEPAQAVEE